MDSVSGDPLINLLEVGDLNGDGHLDLIANRYNNLKKIDEHSQLVQLLGRGDGTFESARKLTTDWSSNLRLLDWNGDGVLDIVFDSGVLNIAYGKGDGSFAEDQRCGVGGIFGSWGTFSVDLNGDGRFDLLWSPHSTNRLSTAFGQGGCDFTPRTDYVFAFEPSGYALGDLDGDGIPDLLVGGRDQKTSRNIEITAFLTGRTDGRFARQPDLAIPWQEYGPFIADVNGD